MIELVQTDLGHGVLELGMHDPEAKQLLTEQATLGLMSALSEAAQAPGLKVLLVTGGCEVFCGGASLDELRRLVAGETDLNEWALPGSLIDFPVPVVAAVEGHAVGGGLMIAACCDIAVGAEESRYGLNFAELGFTPGMGATGLLPALVGYGPALEMILTGKYYRGRELIGAGLFTSVVPRGEVRAAALDIARRIAGKPKHVIEMVKRTLAAPRVRALEEAKRREPEMQKICFRDPDALRRIEEMYLR